MLQLLANPGPASRGFDCHALHAAFDAAWPRPDWGGLAATRILVALFDLRDWQPWLPEAHRLLDPPERGRVQRRRTIGDRDQLALGYALHRLVLGKVLGCDPVDAPIGRDASGCPRLHGERMFTSLSHADRCVALAVTATGPVGVDIEPSARASVMPEIASRVCHPADAAALAALVGSAWSAALLALWVRKEAFLKAAGVGLQRDMQTFIAPEAALLPLPGGGAVQPRMLEAGPRWTAAVAGVPYAPVEASWLQPALVAGMADSLELQ